MLRFYAQPFVKALGYLSAIEEGLVRHENNENYFPTDEDWQTFSRWVEMLDKNLEDLELRLSRRQVARILEQVEKREVAELATAIYQLRFRVYDELDDRLLLIFDGNKADYYDQQMPFGEAVFVNFQSASYDAEQASRCLALGQNTACAFHCFRVAEVGLKTLAKKLGVPDTIPSWDGILKKCDTELKNERKDKEPAWLKEEDFFADAASYVRSYKNSRNNTQHADKKYTDEEAERIFTSVKLLMGHLATKLKAVSEPENLRVADVTSSSITVAWDPPKPDEPM